MAPSNEHEGDVGWILGSLTTQLSNLTETIGRNHTDSQKWLGMLESRLDRLSSSIEKGVEDMRLHALALVRVEGDLRALIQANMGDIEQVGKQVASIDARVTRLEKEQEHRSWYNLLIYQGWKLFLALAALAAAVAQIIHDVSGQPPHIFTP